MAKRIRVPYLFSLLLIENLSELRLVNQSPDVERSLSAAGGLFGAWLHRALERDLSFNGSLLHVFRPRSDGSRAAAQQALERRLSAWSAADRVGDEELRPMLDYLRGGGSRDQAGRAVQQIVGRAFHPAYRATSDSYEAAGVVDSWPRQPWQAAKEPLTNRLDEAKATLAQAAQSDSAAIHGTAIAMHNIVRSLDRLRARYERGQRTRLTDADLAAPALIVRTALRRTTFPFLTRPVEAGTLFVFRLDQLHDDQRAPDFVFMEREWSQCPAHRFVPNLLELAWSRALAS